MIARLLGYLLLPLGLLSALLFPFEQVVQASEDVTALSSPYVHHLWGNHKRLSATLTSWKEIDLVYERLFPYDHSRQPHPPAGCVVLPAISHNSYKQGTGITTPPAVLMLRCRERIDLLRPVRWVRSRLRAQNRQGYLLASIPEMGIMDVHVHMVAVRSSAFNPAIVAMKSASSRPVIGIFIRHTTNVRQYTFKDTLTGKLDTIRATPNHPFYVVNQQRYIPASHLSTHDQLLNVLGHPIVIVCSTGKSSHCGQPYHPGQVIPVYNLEVYGQHRYFVGKPGIMVHNGYECKFCKKPCSTSTILKYHEIIHTGEQPYACHICGRKFNRNGNLMRHVKLHAIIKPFECGICDKAFRDSDQLRAHLSTMKHKILENANRAKSASTEYAASIASGSSVTERVRIKARSRSPNPMVSQFTGLPKIPTLMGDNQLATLLGKIVDNL